RTGDFDTAAGRELSALLLRRDPLGRARALCRLVRETLATGDRFEAARLAEQAALVLAEAGYPDPESDFDKAAQQWVDSACPTCTGSALIAQLCEIAQHWAAILGARASQRMQDDPAASEHAELVLRRISPWAGELLNQADAAEQATAQRFALWCPPQTQPLPERHPAAPLPQGMAALSLLDDVLVELRAACNEGADPSQIDEARALRASALKAGSRIHVTRAWLEEAYVLLALQRPAEAAEASRQALDGLLAGARPALSAFATGFERELYLTAISYQARALMAAQDHAAIIALCEPVIRDLEGERLRVSSPYQQSAFLATRTELYEAVAAAAYNAGQLDLLLETTELLKARSALRNRLAPDMPLDATDVDAELRRVHAALEAAAPGSQEEHSLRERRHWLFSTRSIQRARSGNAMPQVSVASLQSHLGADEAAISWFWIGTAALIVLGVSSDRTIHTVIKLNGEQQARLADYIDCMHALAEPQPRYAVLIPKLDTLIGELGPLLLPQVLHPVIAGKARLVLCPHRTLHLFAFHAVALNGNHLGVTHAIRYTPSLSHLLVPWHGNTQGGVLAVGVARFDDPVLPDLPHAEDEAITIAALHGPQGHALTTASRAQFLSAPLESLRCLHLATHGSSVLAGAAVDDPLACGMHLRDGMLSGWDLLDLRLPAEVVVLATCHSAQRAIAGRGLEQLPGDDLFGLPAMLCQAGVHHLLGALWRVDDGAASTIVRDFHRAYASGATPDTALGEAIRSYLADTTQRHEAFFWAPFTLTTFGR
ncbi:MAG TPA: CHAT domain-containing protein, partial [Alicycliphilus sp.]|nr:CHAT domain-containing protein [Alicycliphilus sp.]